MNQSGAQQAKGRIRFGTSHVVRPTAEHLATVVWLHGVHFKGADVQTTLLSNYQAQLAPLPNVKFICPTGPKRAVRRFNYGGPFYSNAWFDANEVEKGPINFDEVEESAIYITKLIKDEPPNTDDIIRRALGEQFSTEMIAAGFQRIQFTVGAYAIWIITRSLTITVGYAKIWEM